jgi:hypothetical protein
MAMTIKMTGLQRMASPHDQAQSEVGRVSESHTQVRWLKLERRPEAEKEMTVVEGRTGDAMGSGGVAGLVLMATHPILESLLTVFTY